MNDAKSSTPMDLQQIVITRVEYASDERQARHAHAGTNLTLVYRGWLAETVGARCEEAGPLSVVVKPEGTEHADRFGPRGAHTLRLWLSPDFVSDLAEGGRPLAEWRWLHGGATAREMLRLLACTRTSTPANQEIRELVYDVLATLDEAPSRAQPCCAPTCASYGSGARRDVPPWLRRAKACFQDRIADGVRVHEVAAEVGVHPVALARAFRRHFGSSITHFLKQLRVRRAAELMQTETPLSGVAYQAGYADQAHMCRDFKSATGMTPLAFRRLA